jgi:hypothetical protein
LVLIFYLIQLNNKYGSEAWTWDVRDKRIEEAEKRTSLNWLYSFRQRRRRRRSDILEPIPNSCSKTKIMGAGEDEVSEEWFGSRSSVSP